MQKQHKCLRWEVIVCFVDIYRIVDHHYKQNDKLNKYLDNTNSCRKQRLKPGALKGSTSPIP
jgi:hypothetical protein